MIYESKEEFYLDGGRGAGESNARKQFIKERLHNLTCPICDGRSFDQQISREDSRMGFTTFRMQLLICRECSYVLHFAQGQSFFVP